MPKNMGGKSRKPPTGLKSGSKKLTSMKPIAGKTSAKKNPGTSAGKAGKNARGTKGALPLPSGDGGYVTVPIRIGGNPLPATRRVEVKRGIDGNLEPMGLDLPAPRLMRRLLDSILGGKSTPSTPEDEEQEVEPIYAHFYLSEADGLKAVTVAKAFIDYLSYLGYGEVKILEAKQGSLWTRIVAFWNGEDGERAREIGGQKLTEGYQYAEQWAKDAFVNTPMADVTAKNANSVAMLLDSIKDQDDAILHVGNLLVLKVAGKVVVKDLSVPEMAALQKHSGILQDPKTALETLALVVSGGGMAEQTSITSP